MVSERRQDPDGQLIGSRSFSTPASCFLQEEQCPSCAHSLCKISANISSLSSPGLEFVKSSFISKDDTEGLHVLVPYKQPPPPPAPFDQVTTGGVLGKGKRLKSPRSLLAPPSITPDLFALLLFL